MAGLIKQFSGRKRGSCVWTYSKYDEKQDKSRCIVVSLNGSACDVLVATKNPTNLKNHLRTHHHTSHHIEKADAGLDRPLYLRNKSSDKNFIITKITNLLYCDYQCHHKDIYKELEVIEKEQKEQSNSSKRIKNTGKCTCQQLLVVEGCYYGGKSRKPKILTVAIEMVGRFNTTPSTTKQS